MLCGADDFEEIALFGQQKESLLRRYLPLPAGPHAADTYRRVCEKLDVTRFNACCMAWMQEVLPATQCGCSGPSSQDGLTIFTIIRLFKNQ